MLRTRLALVTTLVATALTLTACDQAATSTDVEVAPSQARLEARGSQAQAQMVSWLAQQVDDFNATMAAQGSTLRLDYPWLFTVGEGTDPFMRLRTGTRWTTLAPTYVLDASDFTTDIASGDAEAALVAAYDAWNDVANSSLTAVRVADPGTNMDVLDGTFDPAGNCLTLFDVTSPNLDLVQGTIQPAADIVVGGWPREEYFSSCMGSNQIIAVTWTFYLTDADGNPADGNGDHYVDALYVEQFFNPHFAWVVSGSQFLNYQSGVDLQTIATHEDGHAHGLDHFGGPVVDQQWRLKGNNRVFQPEAVMNPYYLYGEKRALYATDEGALRTLYTGL